MIDYDDLRKQCEDDIGRARVLNATVLRLLDIIAVAKDGLRQIRKYEADWQKETALNFVLAEIARLEKE